MNTATQIERDVPEVTAESVQEMLSIAKDVAPFWQALAESWLELSDNQLTDGFVSQAHHREVCDALYEAQQTVERLTNELNTCKERYHENGQQVVELAAQLRAAEKDNEALRAALRDVDEQTYGHDPLKGAR